jgi:capsule polysaccharide export protein KpsE/RkpR
MTSTTRGVTDHIAIWVRWRWFLIGVTIIAGLLTAVISTIMPKTYRSTAIVLPPYEARMPFSYLGNVSVDIFGGNELPTAGLLTLLRSRALKDSVHARFDLIEHYNQDDIELAYRAFDDHLQVELESEANFGAVNIIAIAISVLDRDPESTARIVNLAVHEWDKLYVAISRRGASLRRQYVEQSLNETSMELATYEDSLRNYQEKHGIASLNVQVEGTVSSAITLEEKRIEAEVAVQILEKLLQPGHPDLRRSQLELEELEKQLRQLQEPSDEVTLLLPLGLAPEISLIYTRIFRRVKTLEAIQAVLVQQFEQAKMQELRDTPALRVVDSGQVPIHKFKPKRLVLTLVAMLSAFFLTLLLIYFLDYRERTRGTEEYRWVEEASAHIRSDFKRLSRFFRRT